MDDIIAFSEIGDFIDVPVKFYSSGMYLRLAFAIGVHLDSDILVIDEALAVGDSQFQAKCIEKIKQIKLEGKPLFWLAMMRIKLRHYVLAVWLWTMASWYITVLPKAL